MSLTRFVVVAAIAGAAFHVFRRDLSRLAARLRGPATAFVRDVRREINEGQGAAPPSLPPSPPTPTAPPSPPSPPSSQPPRPPLA